MEPTFERPVFGAFRVVEMPVEMFKAMVCYPALQDRSSDDSVRELLRLLASALGSGPNSSIPLALIEAPGVAVPPPVFAPPGVPSPIAATASPVPAPNPAATPARAPIPAPNPATPQAGTPPRAETTYFAASAYFVDSYGIVHAKNKYLWKVDPPLTDGIKNWRLFRKLDVTERTAQLVFDAKTYREIMAEWQKQENRETLFISTIGVSSDGKNTYVTELDRVATDMHQSIANQLNRMKSVNLVIGSSESDEGPNVIEANEDILARINPESPGDVGFTGAMSPPGADETPARPPASQAMGFESSMQTLARCFRHYAWLPFVCGVAHKISNETPNVIIERLERLVERFDKVRAPFEAYNLVMKNYQDSESAILLAANQPSPDDYAPPATMFMEYCLRFVNEMLEQSKSWRQKPTKAIEKRLIAMDFSDSIFKLVQYIAGIMYQRVPAANVDIRKRLFSLAQAQPTVHVKTLKFFNENDDDLQSSRLPFTNAIQKQLLFTIENVVIEDSPFVYTAFKPMPTAAYYQLLAFDRNGDPNIVLLQSLVLAEEQKCNSLHDIDILSMYKFGFYKGTPLYYTLAQNWDLTRLSAISANLSYSKVYLNPNNAKSPASTTPPAATAVIQPVTPETLIKLPATNVTRSIARTLRERQGAQRAEQEIRRQMSQAAARNLSGELSAADATPDQKKAPEAAQGPAGVDLD